MVAGGKYEHILLYHIRYCNPLCMGDRIVKQNKKFTNTRVEALFTNYMSGELWTKKLRNCTLLIARTFQAEHRP